MRNRDNPDRQSGYVDIYGSRYTQRSGNGQSSGYPPQRTPRKPQKQPASPVRIFFRVFFVVLLAFALFMLGRSVYQYVSEDKAFDKLAQLVDGDSDDVSEKYRQLYAMNNDFFGWLKIDGTEINYPVMYTPDEPERYLHMNFDGDYSESGVLFIDGDCYPGGKHYIIYGHHMFNGSMFGNLPKYEDYDYYTSHKKVNFDTLTEQGEYEVVAAFYAQAYDVSETGVFKYYNYKSLADELTFNEYFAGVKAASIYDTGITPTFGDDILTLSTCNYHTEDGRFVVVARRVR